MKEAGKMADEITINVGTAKRVLRAVLCLGAAFIPFALGALLLSGALRVPQQPDFGVLVGAFAFFLCSAAFVWVGVAKYP